MHIWSINGRVCLFYGKHKTIQELKPFLTVCRKYQQPKKLYHAVWEYRISSFVTALKCKTNCTWSWGTVHVAFLIIAFSASKFPISKLTFILCPSLKCYALFLSTIPTCTCTKPTCTCICSLCSLRADLHVGTGKKDPGTDPYVISSTEVHTCPTINQKPQ